MAFARWNLSHLQVFELPDGRRVCFADVDPDEHGWLDHEKLKVARELAPGEEFRYTFDLGDDWRHRCRVEEKIDPHLLFEAGDLPRQPVVIWGGDGYPISMGAWARRDSLQGQASIRWQMTAHPSCINTRCRSAERS